MGEKDIKKSFIIYLDYEDQFNLLTDEQAGKLIKLIIEYEKTKKVKEIDDGMIKMAFSFIKAQLDRDAERWQDEIIKRRAAGKKGMESRWKKNKSKSEEDNLDSTDSNDIETNKNNDTIKVYNKNNNVKNAITRNNKNN